MRIFVCLLWCSVVVADYYNHLGSPCVDVFRYGYDENSGLYGVIVINSPDDVLVQLNVDLSVGNPVQGFNGQLELVKEKRDVVADVLERKPIMYKLIFPQWNAVPPKVTRISVNSRDVCYGPPITGSRITTSINLQHKLHIDIPKTDNHHQHHQSPPPQLTPNQYDFDRKRDTHSVVKPVINFNPKKPKDPSKVFRGNPFLTGLATTNPIFHEDDDVEFHDVETKADVPEVVVISNGRRPQNGAESQDPVPPMWFAERQKSIVIPTMTTSTFKADMKTTTTTTVKGLLGMKDFLPYSEVCGRSVVVNSLVVKGEPVPRGAFPWLVAMFVVKNLGPEFRCSGSLVSNRHILTAAHCVQTSSSTLRPEELLLVLGKLNIRNWAEEGGLQMGVERVEVHPDYRPLSADADVALLTLSRDVEFTKSVRPVCLWTGMLSTELRNVVGRRGTVVGWGRNEHGDYMTDVPKRVEAPVVGLEECLRSKESFADIVSDRTFCAGSRDGSGPCNGDSGGGFLLEESGRWILRGIVSTSLYDRELKTCDLNNYVVFTDIAKFSDWILSRIKR